MLGLQLGLHAHFIHATLIGEMLNFWKNGVAPTTLTLNVLHPWVSSMRFKDCSMVSSFGSAGKSPTYHYIKKRLRCWSRNWSRRRSESVNLARVGVRVGKISRLRIRPACVGGSMGYIFDILCIFTEHQPQWLPEKPIRMLYDIYVSVCHPLCREQ